MRLIDADLLIEQIDTERNILVKDGRLGAEHILVHYVREFIEDAPTVDAVQVVHCKDCKYSDTYNLSDEPTDMPLKCLGIRYGGVYENCFCEHGERK